MPGLLVGDVFRNAARAVPQRVAAVHGDRSLTYRELDTVSDGVAAALLARGIAHGDRVAVWSGTTIDVIPVFAALAKIGAVFVPLGGNVELPTFTDVLALARPRLLVVDGPRAVAAGYTEVDTVTLDELLTVQALPLLDAVSDTDPHAIVFTSGTSSRPRGVVLSHRVSALRTHPGALYEPRGTMVCVYPLSRMIAWTLSLQQWQGRDTVVYLDRPDGEAIAAAIRGHHATRLNAMPAVWQWVLDHLGHGGRLPMLRFADTGNVATPPSLLAAISHACPNATLRVFYGFTEAGNVASLVGDDVFRRNGSVGVPSISTEIRLTEEGEICIRGPLLFDGYFDDPVATSAVLVDGWYHSGDAGALDADGYLYITGRLAPAPASNPL